MLKIKIMTGILVCFFFVIFPIVNITNGTTVKERNLIELVTLSERILIGRIISLTDGIDANSAAPYTEITLRLFDKIKGTFTGEIYTFRQFGLIKPRPDSDEKFTNLMVTPPGFPTYEVGEEVLLFLCKEGSITGFCSPIGLLQGKFIIKNKQIENGVSNQGLFSGVSVSELTLTDNEKKLLSTRGGAISAEPFIMLIKKMAKAY